MNKIQLRKLIKETIKENDQSRISTKELAAKIEEFYNGPWSELKKEVDAWYNSFDNSDRPVIPNQPPINLRAAVRRGFSAHPDNDLTKAKNWIKKMVRWEEENK